MKEEDCKLCQYYSKPKCTHAVDFSIEGLMGNRPRAQPPQMPAYPQPLAPFWMTNDAFLLSAYFFKLGYYQPAGPLISPGPLHGGFKTDGGSSAGSAPPPQDTGYGRYPYPQPQQVMHYNPHSHSPYGPGSGYGPTAPPAPPRLPTMPPPPSASCYRPPPPAHRSHPTQHQPHPPYRPPPPSDNQVSPAGTDAYAPQFCPPCYQHPHAPPRQAISYLESAYQGCPCPMQSCPKNVHTGPATGNPPASSGPSQSSTSGGKRISQESSGGGCCAVALNPSLGLVPPETLGPPSPARGSAGLDPPHPPRRARLGKAMARKSIAPEEPPGHTTLLMCHPVPPPPLTINTDPLPPKVETVKSEEDSGDDVIIIDSPNSKLAPIDLSSSDENNCNDSKSEKDCEIVRKEEKDPVVVDISTETKKETVENVVKTSEQPVSTSESQSKLDTKPQELPSNAKSKSISEPVKKCSDVKSKSGTKRRCSNLDIDMEVEIDDSLAANGIGEHVKLQKRQKVLQNDTLQPKKNGAMTGKGFMKKNNRLLTLTTSNVKKHLNNTTKVDKYKQTCKLPVAVESDKGSSKKIGAKRKSTTPVEEVPTNKRKKLSQSLLKSADKKQAAKSSQDDVIDDKIQKEKILPVPKAKSVALLDNLLMKNNLDRVIDCVARNIPSDSSEPVSVLNPAALFSVTTATSSPRASRKVSMLKPKKCPQISEDLARVNSGKTVLNINNNVVKKAIESDCEIVPIQKAEDKITTDKHSRTKSKSPAAVNRLTERKSIDIAAKIKNQSEPDNIVKDIPLAVTKIEGIVKGKKCKGKRKSKSIDNTEFEEADLALLNRPIGQPRWSNGWVWEGESQLSRVYINNEDTIKARCWSAMRHSQAGDTVKRGDSVLLRAGARRSEAPFVAKVSQLWENPPDGEMMVSLLWYYRPEHTERGRQPDDCTDEVFASKHRDANSVACIEDKCYVLTYNEYCRYRKQLRASEENIRCPPSIVPSMPKNDLTPSITTNDAKIPLNISPDLVLFCRRIYDFRLKKVLKPQQSLQHLRYNV